MLDEEFNALMQRIDALIDAWREPLGLTTWLIKTRYHRDSGVFNDEHGECSAACSANWPYLVVTLSFNMPKLAESADDELEEIVVHECCHILVCEMQKKKSDKNHVERVVTQLARAFIRTRDSARGG